MTVKTMIILALLLMSPLPALSSQTVSMRNYNVTLDLGEKNAVMEPLSSSSTMDSILHTIKFRGSGENDYAMIYLYEYQTAQSFDLKDRLWKLMKSYCTMVDIDSATLSGLDGFLASGYARVKSGFGKQVCYSGIVALPSGALGQRDLVVLAHFTNASLNEEMVKTMQVDYVGQTVKIQA